MTQVKSSDRYDPQNRYYYPYYKLDPRFKDCIILGIRTEYLNKRYVTPMLHYGEIWFTYSKDIPLEALFYHDYYSLPNEFDNDEWVNQFYNNLLQQEQQKQQSFILKPPL